jgi:serine protease Do
MDHPHGALVGRVEPGSPADKSGIKDGDVIIQVDGSDVPRSEDLPRLIAAHRPGTQVKVTALRDRQSRSFDIVLAALQDNADKPAMGRSDSGADRGERASSLGISVADDAGHVVVARVAPDGPASGKIREDDVIVEIDHQRVTSASDVATKLSARHSDKPVLLRIKRGDEEHYVAITSR